jgi:hypothetical protein
MNYAVNAAGRDVATTPAPKEQTEEETLFLSMHMANTDSVEKLIPLQEARGPVKLIPCHIRGSNRNSRKAMLSMQSFRRKSEAAQLLECTKWRNMGKKERLFHQTILEDLCELKRNLADEKVSWDDIAPDPAKELEELSRSKRLARKAAKDAKEKDSKKAHVEEFTEGQRLVRGISGATGC